MNTKSTEAMANPLGPGHWTLGSSLARARILAHHVQRAREVIVDRCLACSDSVLLEWIVMAAVEANSLLYGTAVHPPSRELLDRRFVAFICDALQEEEV